MLELKTVTLDEKKIGFTSQTEFLVQVGKGKKGRYKTVAKFTGQLYRAVMYYNGINIDDNHKKRLVSPNMNKPILARMKGMLC